MKELSDKVLISPKQFEKIAGTAEARHYRVDTETGYYEKDLSKIRRVHKAWSKSPKFLLQLSANLEEPVYLTAKPYSLGTKKEARRFAKGFDDEDLTIKRYSDITGLKFVIKNI